MSLPERPLGEAIHLSSTRVPVIDDEEYRIAGIYSFGRGLIKRPTITGAETSYSTLTRIDTDQLVMSKLNAWEGALAVVFDEFSGSHVSPEYPVFDIDRNVADPGYIKHLVTWPKLWGRLTPQGSMVRRKRTTPTTLMATTVPLPDLEEQRRIATRLNSAMQKLSLIGEKREHAGHLRNALRDSILQQEGTGKSTRLGDVLALERTPVEVEPETEYTQIGIRSFGNGIFHRDKLPGRELSKLRYFWIQPDRLLVSNIMAWEGAIAISTTMEKGCVGSSRFLSFAPSEDIDLRYLNYYFQSGPGINIIRSTSTGTVLRNQTLSVGKFENITIPLPDLRQQQRVADFLDGNMGMGSLAQNQMPTTSALRQSFLYTAFSGQL